MKIEWHDAGREPQCPPDPAYPSGKDVAAPRPSGLATCKVDLPYPARRVGWYEVRCELCGASAGCTTAGRPDDPRSIEVWCRLAAGGRPQ
jgi:hypothetical protein